MALYGYSYKLPKLSDNQKEELVNLALKTARKASVVDKGVFRKGWRARTVGNNLIVDTRVPHAVFVERGLGYNRHNRYKVRDALNSIGFERYFQKEIGSLTVPAAAITATAVATASGSDTEGTQEAPNSQNTTQTPKPNTLITSDELIGLNALEIKNLIVQRTSIANITAKPQLQKPIETGNYFDVDSLLLLIAAAVAANELTKEEDNGKNSNQEE